MRIMICDDQRSEIERITALCEEYIEKKDISAVITGVTDPNLIWENMPDVLLLDIEMPGQSGIEIKDQLETEEKLQIIFVTSHEEAMVNAFGLNVIGFIIKPVTYEALEKKLNVAVNRLVQNRDIHFEDGSVINSKEILGFRSGGKYTQGLLTERRTKEHLRKGLDAWEKELSNLGFMRINKSNLVNCRHVESFLGDEIAIGEEVLVVSRRRRGECFDRLLKKKTGY